MNRWCYERFWRDCNILQCESLAITRERSFSLLIHESKSKRSWLEAYRSCQFLLHCNRWSVTAGIHTHTHTHTHTHSQLYRIPRAATPRGIIIITCSLQTWSECEYRWILQSHTHQIGPTHQLEISELSSEKKLCVCVCVWQWARTSRTQNKFNFGNSFIHKYNSTWIQQVSHKVQYNYARYTKLSIYHKYTALHITSIHNEPKQKLHLNRHSTCSRLECHWQTEWHISPGAPDIQILHTVQRNVWMQCTNAGNKTKQQV